MSRKLIWPVKSVTAPRGSAGSTSGQAIHEDKRPWAGTPWLIGGVLTGGAFVVGLKNAKRTHLD